MLVLSRRRGESVMIGDGIEVTILDIAADKVRIGVEAPDEFNVYRKEVAEKLDDDVPPEAA